MKYIYIACPYSIGDPYENVLKCIAAADHLAKLGYFPFAPLLFHFWDQLYPHSYEFWINQSIAWMEKCDAVIRLPGESKGADQEVARAIALGIPVYGNEFIKSTKETQDVSNRSSVGSDSSQGNDSRGESGG